MIEGIQMLTEINRIARAMQILPETRFGARSAGVDLRRPPRWVVVIGDTERADEVWRALEGLSVDVRRAPTVDYAVRRGMGRARAHVLVSPLSEQTLASAIGRLEHADAVFAVTHDPLCEQCTRRLYEAGAGMVLQWPDEASRLRPTIQRWLGGPVAPRRTTRDDEALARSVRTRLGLAMPAMPGLSVRVDDGVVEVRGRVASLWDKRRVSRSIAHIPGVRAMLDDAVEVVPRARPKPRIARDVRRILEIVLGDAMPLVSFSIESGELLLVGTVEGQDSLERLQDALSNVRGLQAVRNLITVLTPAAPVEGGIDEDLSRALGIIYPGHALSVECFGPVAVLEGRVDRLATRREIERIVARHGGIERVVDKVDVVPLQDLRSGGAACGRARSPRRPVGSLASAHALRRRALPVTGAA